MRLMITLDQFFPPAWERVLPNYFDVETLRHLGGAALARALLEQTSVVPGKAQARQRELLEHPELRISVNTTELLGIIDYAAFMCHPGCSVARDEAKRKSDIDNGLVVLREPVAPAAELSFIAALRRQGFDVCHPSEAQAADDAFKAFDNERLAISDEDTAHVDWEALEREFVELEAAQRLLPLKQISFVNEAEIAYAAAHGPLTPETAVYLAGFSIQ